jgi:hypothetical protein
MAWDAGRRLETGPILSFRRRGYTLIRSPDRVGNPVRQRLLTLHKAAKGHNVPNANAAPVPEAALRVVEVGVEGIEFSGCNFIGRTTHPVFTPVDTARATNAGRFRDEHHPKLMRTSRIS